MRMSSSSWQVVAAFGFAMSLSSSAFAQSEAGRINCTPAMADQHIAEGGLSTLKLTDQDSLSATNICGSGSSFGPFQQEQYVEMSRLSEVMSYYPIVIYIGDKIKNAGAIADRIKQDFKLPAIAVRGWGVADCALVLTRKTVLSEEATFTQRDLESGKLANFAVAAARGKKGAPFAGDCYQARAQ